MKQPQRRDPATDVPAEPRLGGVRPLSFDEEDERPSREDKTFGETIFSRPVVPYPRWLTGRKKQRR